jgi:hypothetical protein
MTTIGADKTETIEIADGSTITTKKPDGHVIIDDPDGTTIDVSPTGSTIKTFPTIIVSSIGSITSKITIPQTASMIATTDNLKDKMDEAHEDPVTIKQQKMLCDSVSTDQECFAATVTEIGSRGREHILRNNQGHPTSSTNHDGTVATIYPDGTKIVKRPDGTIITSHTGGTEIIEKPGFGGSTIIKKPNGTMITIDADGNIDKVYAGKYLYNHSQFH